MGNTLWNNAVRTGLAADRPTVPDGPSETFVFFYATDTAVLSLGVGGAWVSTTAMIPTESQVVAVPTGVTASYGSSAVTKLTLTLVDVAVAVADADDYGSAEIVTLPDRNIIIVGCEVNLELVKDGVGFINTTDLDVALGTAAASNTTLASTMLDILPKVDLNATDLSPALASHSLATTLVLTPILDAATNKVYLNVSGPTETGEAATITASGTVEIHFIDAGNTTS